MNIASKTENFMRRFAISSLNNFGSNFEHVLGISRLSTMQNLGALLESPKSLTKIEGIMEKAKNSNSLSESGGRAILTGPQKWRARIAIVP